MRPSAPSTALERMAFEILNDHVTHYVQGALASGDPKAAKEKSEELLAEVERFTETR